MKHKYAGILKYVSWTAYLAALATHAALLFVFGISTIITTLLAYSLLCILTIMILSPARTVTNKDTVQNLKVLFLSVFLTLLAGELTLKYLFRLNLTYNEIHGSFYFSEYKKAEKQNFKWKEFFKPGFGWIKTNTPNSSRIIERDNFRYKHSYNSLGLRDLELTSILSDSTKIVLGLGDSFTEGVGAAQDSTWLKFFERKWSEQGYRPPLKTFNAGISGSDVFYEYQLLIKLLEKLQPAIVFVSINESDLDEILIRGGTERFKSNGTVAYNSAPWWESIYALSFISRAVINNLYHPDWTLLTAEQKNKNRQAAMNSIEACVRSFSKLSVERKFKLVIIFNPIEKEVKNQMMIFDPLISNLQNDTSLIVINLLEEFRKGGLITTANCGNYFWPIDFHHNAKGYKVWGDIISEYIHQNRFLH